MRFWRRQLAASSRSSAWFCRRCSSILDGCESVWWVMNSISSKRFLPCFMGLLAFRRKSQRLLEGGALRTLVRSRRTCNMACLLANNISFMRGFVPFLLILIPILCEIDSADCEQKGFSSSLLCSSCDKLSAFVGDSVGIPVLTTIINRDREWVQSVLYGWFVGINCIYRLTVM